MTTKLVRIENADNCVLAVRVTVQVKNDAGKWVDLPRSVQIDRPAQMTEQYISRRHRIVIEARPADSATL